MPYANLTNLLTQSLNFNINYCGLEDNPNHNYIYNSKSDYVFQYVFEGKGIFSIYNKVHTLKAGDLFFIPPNVLSQSIADKKNPYKYFYVGFSSTNIVDYLPHLGFSESTPIIHLGNQKEYFDMFKSMLDNSNNFTILNMLKIQQTFLQIIYSLCKVNNLSNESLLFKSQKNVSIILNYIHANFNQPINVSSIADYIGLNRCYISKIFKLHTNRTIVDYIIDYRLNQAAIMIRQNNKNITQIAFDCGFTDSKSFYTRFKAKLGISPKRYQIIMRNDAYYHKKVTAENNK